MLVFRRQNRATQDRRKTKMYQNILKIGKLLTIFEKGPPMRATIEWPRVCPDCRIHSKISTFPNTRTRMVQFRRKLFAPKRDLLVTGALVIQIE